MSSHVLSELEKIATHYGIIRGGMMLKEMTAEELDASCRTYTALRTNQMQDAKKLLKNKYFQTNEDENGWLRVYDPVFPEKIVTYLYENGVTVCEVKTAKINLEELYVDLMGEE